VCGTPCTYSVQATTDLHVFTTRRNPLGTTWSDSDLVPLYRMSWDNPAISTSHVSHIYTVSTAEVAAAATAGYRQDGIEGYLWRCGVGTQPPGTVKVYRKGTAAATSRPNAVIVSEAQLAGTLSAGYTSNLFSSSGCSDASGHEYIGFAYPNIDTDGDGLIDGFEDMIGTCKGVARTNLSALGDGYFLTEPTYDPGSCAAFKKVMGALLAIVGSDD
jgi:hypothetical protein